MKKVEISVYRFNELNDKSRETVLNYFAASATEDKWWESIYDDAETIGLKITGFQLDRSKGATGNLLISALDVAFKIRENHGEEGATYKTALEYLTSYDTLAEQYNAASEDMLMDYDAELENLDTEFTESLLEDYANMLQNECDYLQSEENAIEVINGADYWFTEEGEIFSDEVETQGNPENGKFKEAFLALKEEALKAIRAGAAENGGVIEFGELSPVVFLDGRYTERDEFKLCKFENESLTVMDKEDLTICDYNIEFIDLENLCLIADYIKII